MMAWHALQSELAKNAKERFEGTRPIFYHTQALLAALANLSKLFWGDKRDKDHEKELEQLRDSLGVSQDLFHKGKVIRNHYEHVDERIWEWSKESPKRTIVNMNVVPIRQFTNYPLSGKIYFGI